MRAVAATRGTGWTVREAPPAARLGLTEDVHASWTRIAGTRNAVIRARLEADADAHGHHRGLGAIRCIVPPELGRATAVMAPRAAVSGVGFGVGARLGFAGISGVVPVACLLGCPALFAVSARQRLCGGFARFGGFVAMTR